MKWKRILVTDFDGTMTDRDFYSIVCEHFLPPSTPNYWLDYRDGKITHFDALSKYFAAIVADENSVVASLSQMRIDPNLKEAIKSLHDSGWKIVIASAGCRWYIDQLLAGADVTLDVYANPGRFESGRGLVMELPTDSPFLSREHGIHKAGIVNHFMESGATVAFAGDGFPDVEAALIVDDQFRFARRDLANVLSQKGEAFQTFREWSEIAQHLNEQHPL